MKRKFLLFTLMLALFVCALAISISADEIVSPSADATFTVNGTAYPLWEAGEDGTLHPLMWYQDGDKLSKVWADNMDSSKAPYVKYNAWSDSDHVQMKNFSIIDASGNTFDGKATVVIANLNNIYIRNDGRGITRIHKEAFNGSSVLKAVYIPNTLKAIGWGSGGNDVSFAYCSALEYAEFHSQTSSLSLIDSNSFLNCTSLKAISIPEGITKINTVAFAGCTSLQAIYLPSTLEEFADNSWDTGAFYNCKNAYFVQEPFKLNSTCTNIPAKPQVYYFPPNLTIIDETTRNMANLNDVIVFGDKMVNFDSNGFTGTGTSGQTKTVVFTGVMQNFKLGDATGYTINFIFTNTTDTSVITTRTDRGYVDSCAYLCKANKTGKLGYGVKWEDGTTHFVDASKTVELDATCLDNKKITTYCYCTTLIGASEEAETALGHEFNLENGAALTNIVYEKGFSAQGYKEITCARCSETNNEDVAKAIFEGFGYSTREEDGTKYGLVLSYIVNKEALTAYETAMNTTLTYGVLAIAEQNVSGNPLENDGTPNVESIVATDVTGVSAVDLIIWGKANDWDTVIDEETGKTVKDISFYILGYVIEGDTLNYFYDVTSSETLTDLSTKSYNGAKA